MSEIKVNKISPRAACGTVQLGDSGDTFTIPAGASITNSGTASGFGATGSASWNTTVKTSGFTAVAGEGYFVNTTGGAISVNLPAGTAGAVVAFKDYASTFQTNKLTLVQNGSDKIGGSTVNADISTEGIAVTLVFVDSTQGWLITDDGTQSVAVTNPFIAATGGTITESGNFKIHTFTGPGNFTVSKTAESAPNNVVEYLVVAGGGSGGKNGGGGGAGGTRFFATPACAPGAPALPLNGPAGITVTATTFPIAVGGGGAVQPGSSVGGKGSVSTFSTITSTGGGGGGNGPGAPLNGPSNADTAGGSGGGAGRDSGPPANPSSQYGRGNTPPTSPAQGTDGGSTGNSAWSGGGGGGGFVGAGGNGGGPGSPSTETGGNGGTGGGLPAAIFGANGIPCGSYRYYAGGGGGAINGSNGSIPTGANGSGGLGGGGAGFIEPAAGGGRASVAGTDNTGGGGGGGTACAQAGGSGIVVIRYRFQ